MNYVQTKLANKINKVYGILKSIVNYVQTKHIKKEKRKYNRIEHSELRSDKTDILSFSKPHHYWSEHSELRSDKTR